MVENSSLLNVKQLVMQKIPIGSFVSNMVNLKQCFVEWECTQVQAG